MTLQRYRRKLAGSVHKDEVFSYQDLRNGIMVGATYDNCTFKSCKMNSLRMEASLFIRCHFEDCDLQHANMMAKFQDCSFLKCNLDNVNLVTAILERTLFEDCRMEYAALSRATMVGGGIVDTALHGAYMDMAGAEGVDFSGSNLWGAVLPMSCAIFVGNKFDHRQLHLLLGLVYKSLLSGDDAQRISLIADPRMVKMVDRLTRVPVDATTGVA